MMERVRLYCVACKAAHVPTETGECGCACHVDAGRALLNRTVEHLAQSGLSRASAELAGMADVLLTAGAPPRTFPMMNGPQIPWSLAEKIYLAVYVVLFGGDQSLSRIAERGGFSWSEVDRMSHMYLERFGTSPKWEE